MFDRANPVRPCELMPDATAAKPPSMTYWAAEAARSRPAVELMACATSRPAGIGGPFAPDAQPLFKLTSELWSINLNQIHPMQAPVLST
jgi:hypothetical protein